MVLGDSVLTLSLTHTTENCQICGDNRVVQEWFRPDFRCHASLSYRRSGQQLLRAEQRKPWRYTGAIVRRCAVGVCSRRFQYRLTTAWRTSRGTGNDFARRTRAINLTCSHEAKQAFRIPSCLDEIGALVTQIEEHWTWSPKDERLTRLDH